MRFRQISNDRVVNPQKAIMLSDLIKELGYGKGGMTIQEFQARVEKHMQDDDIWFKFDKFRNYVVPLNVAEIIKSKMINSQKKEGEKESIREHVEHMKEQSRSYDRRMEKRRNERKESDRRESEEENRRRERYYQDRKEWNSWE